MKLSLLTGILAVSLSGTMSAYASQTVVTFEDGGPDPWSDSYGGLSGWWGAGSGMLYWGANNPALGDYIFHGGIGGAELSFDQAPVVFEGMYYNFWGDNSQISYSLYYQDQLVYSAPLDPYNQPHEIYWLASGYEGLVDKIFFYGTHDGFVIDNLTYSTSPVPVPGAIWLFGSGLAGLLSFVKRRKTG